ncbi:MAG: CopD family protein [Ilumatobacteraceae bacterium]
MGALAFAAWVLRGEREDIALVLGWARRSGVAIIAGGLIELVAQTNLEAVGDWGATFSGSNARAALASSFGIAVALRIVGGVLLLTGTRMTTRPVVAPAADLAVPQAALIGVGGAQPSAADRPPPPATGGDRAWQPSPASSMALVGVGLILASHIFGGHTVTEGYRPLTAILDTIHVAAAAIWAGGLVMIIAVSWKRFVEDRSLRTGELAVRFSVVAAAALAAVTVAGLGLSIIILDAPAELWTTPWGRLLVAKVAFAGVAIAAGAYNHRVLVPALHADPDDESVVTRFRTAVAAEVALLLVVGVLTAFLVGASSV